jgi:magnesium chelatase family protein
MSNATVMSRAQRGVDAPLVRVEVHCGPGLPALSIVGLPEAAVRESKDRVRAALLNAGYEFPAGRITVNLAPADLPKEGGRYDLAIALGILAASGQLAQRALEHHEFLGELALGGALRAVRGALPAALATRAAGRALVVAAASAAEAALGHPRAHAASHLLEVCAHLAGSSALPVAEPPPPGVAPAVPDLAEVRGQHGARRALEVAAAGEHALLLVGPPGAGKSMLAQRLPGVLPPLDDEAALEAAAVQSLGGEGFDAARWRVVPFRAPHHTASAVALCGGGASPRPGEVSLAHRGVLFLDELPEFDRRVLEVLREPLESGRIAVSRAARQAEFPARFQLVAAMNPCPCGWAGDASGRCRCGIEQQRRYRGRISGPLLDRIDVQCAVPRLAAAEVALDAPPGEASAAVAARVAAARARMQVRQGRPNARLGPSALARHCLPDRTGRALLERAIGRQLLSARAQARLLTVARTIADLGGRERVGAPEVAEAIALRALDRGLDG